MRKEKGAQYIKPGDALENGANLSYKLYKAEEPMTTWMEKIEVSLGLGFIVFLVSSVIAAVISAVISAIIATTTVSGFVVIDLIVFVILFGYSLYEIFSDKSKKIPDALDECMINLASTYFTITNDEGVKKVHFKFIQSIQYIEHHLVVKADYPKHGQYEYEIPLYDSKGRKLSSPQIKQLYQALNLGRQNNR